MSLSDIVSSYERRQTWSMTTHTLPAKLHPHRPSISQNADLPIITVEAIEIDEPLAPRQVGRANDVGTELEVYSGGSAIAASSAPASSTTMDLSVIRQAVEGAPHGTSGLDVYVAPNGDVAARGQAPGAAARLSTVVGDTFYNLDLNAIQQATLAAQRNGGQVADKDRVYVDQNGEVMLGSDVGDPSRAAEVVGDTFFARDLLHEARATAKMPPSVKVSDGTYEGYSYSITNRFGDKYDLFIYYHPTYSVYRVALVSPRLGGELDVHGGHLYSDGTLCLTKRHGSGYPSMEETYAKSALWTLGASLYRRGYGFQFNIGQDGASRA